MNELIVRIAGTAGQGVISSGDIFSLAAARSGYYVTTYRSFPSEIRGEGQCAFQLRISQEKTHTVGHFSDVLVAFNQKAVDVNVKHLKSGGILLVDSDEVSELSDESFTEIIKYYVPITTIAKEVASAKAKNMVSIGLIAGLISQIPMREQFKNDIRRRYAKYSEEVIESNIKAFEAGYEYASSKLERHDNLNNISMSKSGEKLIMSGNEAIALGALVAGCRFYSGYPITPATEIMEWLARELPKVGGVMLQCEDEIASVTAAIGASYGGTKAMTATSGPGFSLMSEAIGLATMAEIPLVVVDVQRGGPSTGLPTKSEQSDLNMAIYGTHGEGPKIVLAPMDVQDCFIQTINAFNYAEQYQVPVILLSDAAVGQRRECVDLINFDSLKIVNRLKHDRTKDAGLYVRYKNTKSGISPIATPGDEGGAYVATGLEHTELCNPTSDPEIRKMMVEKRFRKLETATHEFISAKKYGPDDAKIGIISWGSTTGAVLEAVDMAKDSGYKIQALYPRTLYPLPQEWLQDFLADKEIVIVVEHNYTAQLLHTLVYRCNSINRDIKFFEILKYDGSILSAREVYDRIDKIIRQQSLRYTFSNDTTEHQYKF
ncbi:MAG TPA: 2-oxoacid:acceptor oxidoreductase subunit alpha [Candidatus Adamsella sp.]|nr:2-oxoacid:acceptor oxidoreductase subunit alpha [Candidatus Adamsella sp.]